MDHDSEQAGGAPRLQRQLSDPGRLLEGAGVPDVNPSQRASQRGGGQREEKQVTSPWPSTPHQTLGYVVGCDGVVPPTPQRRGEDEAAAGVGLKRAMPPKL